MMKKALALAAVLLVAVAGVAHATASYPIEDDKITITGTVAPNSTVTIAAERFAVGATVTISMNDPHGFSQTPTADSSGIATISQKLNKNAEGNKTITATGLGSDGNTTTVTKSICLTGCPASVQGQSISRTVGADGLAAEPASSGTPIARIALGAVAAGGLLMLVGNRRRTAKV